MPRPLTSEIWACPPAFQFRCPRKWESLRPGDEPGVRFCDSCDKSVFLCADPVEFVERGNRGECVAVHAELVPGLLRFDTLGRPDAATLVRKREAKKQIRVWWNQVLDHEPQFLPSAFERLYPDLGRVPTPAPAAQESRPSLQQTLAASQDERKPGLQETMRLFLQPGARRPGLQESFPPRETGEPPSYAG